jgi:hypothetical protein
MEKILLAIDPLNPDKNAFDFACYLSRLTKSKITGVFLENTVAEERTILKTIKGMSYFDWEVDEKAAEHQAKIERVEENIKQFKERCSNMETGFTWHRDHGIPASDLAGESRFADVIIIDGETSFKKNLEGTPTEFAREVLKKTECPVIIAPESFEGIEEIVFAYNGSASSVFAIKQFTYLFPQYHDKKVTIVKADESGQWQDPDKHKFSEWLKDHYENIDFEALKGGAEEALFEYAFKKQNMFLVMGSYGRSAISTFLRKSRAELLIKTITQPIFIAHL